MLQSGYNQLITFNTAPGDAVAQPADPADLALDEVECRILGALIEKEMATPEYYPLSLNALVNACNQKSNRRPVVEYDENTVSAGLERLREKGLAGRVSGGDNRVVKYRQNFSRVYSLEPAMTAIVAVLLLRGPLTPGEIRGCTASLHVFGELSEVDEILRQLGEESSAPMILRLPRQPGQKEVRFAHLLSGPPAAVPAPEPTAPVRATTRPAAEPASPERIQRLEEEVAGIRQQLRELSDRFEEFRRALE